MSVKKANMDMQTILIVILIGIAAGMLSGLVGIGGGLIIVPALVYFLGFSQHTAQGTSLGLILLPVGILGVLQYYKQGNVDVKVVAILAVGFLIGSYYGSKVSLNLPQTTVKKIFAVLMILIAIKMLFLDKPKVDKKIASTNTGIIEK
ncbi:sulfite exporter TauE/SafE family protein [Ferruginibacter lapsinanis]|uniref:sulfite exporter TauE/SafE family protein n=1 Tax=Ferruginibacter lapsinanis TaxID=563172 RepID=UPI001E53E3FB|nr:sulfite exporter TauE/SafE family protein [Ferruginibacter lapsinanis]UEG48693.1 sulfite exporter TauE/SafE family protein [Ferruginibacter lapsinanis]